MRSERHTKGLDFSTRGGRKLPEQRAQHEPGINRNFRIGERPLIKFGPSAGRKACDAKTQGVETRAARSEERRARMEQAMREDDIEKDIISRRDARRRHTHFEHEPPQPPEE